jgi:hypothetical protein
MKININQSVLPVAERECNSQYNHYKKNSFNGEVVKCVGLNFVS